MSYLVLARKWRPQTFIDLIGQEHVSRTLQNAIDSGRVAHAFLFTGARGVGKTSSARILAKALNCDTGPTIEPCNTCPTCLEITAGTSVDVQEIDGASNTGVDDVRELRETIKYLPSRSRYKIYVIDEVHMLSTNAFNALLKTLEEPPAHVKFIFATTEPHKLPITILSRCQRFDFKRIPLRQVVDRLRFIVNEEHVAITETALAAIAKKGDGSMRDSLSTLDQVLAFCGSTVVDDDVATLLGVVDRRILLETSAAILAKDTRAVLHVVKRVDSFGYGIRQFCQELIEHFRNLVMMVVLTDPLDVLDLAEAELAELRAQVEGATPEELQRHLAMLLKAESEMGPSSFPRIVLELVLVKMASLPPVVPVDQLLGYLRKLEARVADGVAGPAPVWDAAKSAAPSAPPRPVAPKPPESPRPAEDRSSVSTPPVSPPGEQVPAPSRTAPPRGGDWEGFVVMVAGKKPILGSYLEHARPMNVSPEVLDIGFDSGFYLDQVKDADTLEILKGFAAAFFGGQPSVKVRLAEAETKAAAPTLVEKKSAENEEAAGRLRDEAASHPMVSAVLEIFGGELGEIKKR